MTINRRGFLTGSAVTAGGLALFGPATEPVEAGCGLPHHPGAYELPPLPYDYDALEPYIDKQTMTIHHGKHHAGYTKGLNAALGALEQARASGDYADIQKLERKLAFHLGGYVNHSVFWKNMSPDGGGDPSGTLAKALKQEFGSVDAFRAHFSAAAAKVEGNGWGVLAFNPYLQRLLVLTLMNQQDLIAVGAVPLLMLDVWEHAYYIKYQNRRGDYIKAWWNVVNWKDVAERYEKAMGIRV